jgi:predicted TIM-barrel fold metal-dependent hydrolase
MVLGTALAVSFGADRAAAQGGLGGTPIDAGEECPPGMTEVRPRSCRAPEFSPPSILDYRPRSTLVAEENLVPRARYPVVDVHGHQSLTSQEAINNVVAELDRLNVRVYMPADNLSGERLRATLAAIDASPHRDRFRVFAGVNFNDVGPGWSERAVRQLEQDIQAGAVGVGEIPKSLGLTTMKADGTRLRVDDPELDAVWLALARLNVPVFIHTAEPREFFQPLDMHNERWLELSLFADRRNYEPGQVSFEQLMTERDNMIRRNPDTQFIVAHFGWHANDLPRAARLLDEFQNVVVEVGAILHELGRQPRAAREFFIKYQDRILFGKDAFQPTEYPYFWRVFETADEYFDYYRGYHAFWKMYGMDLPDEVLKKVYYQNALRVIPGLPRTGWPE